MLVRNTGQEAYREGPGMPPMKDTEKTKPQLILELEELRRRLADDDSERKRTLRALQDSQQMAQAILNASTESMLLIGLDWRILTLNDEAAAHLGGTVGELIGRSLEDILPADVFKRRSALAEEAVRARRSVSHEDQDNGRDYHACLYPVFDADGNVSNLAVYAQDVTEQKAAEKALRQEQGRLRRLLDMHERDRKLVAYEIHDALSQPLTGALMLLEGTLGARYPDKIPDECHQAVELLRHGIRETRRLISWERPFILDEQGLLEAVEHLVSGFSVNGGPEIVWSHDVRFDRLASPLETAIYRIIWESVTNARKHSQSDKVRIGLVQQNHHLSIEVEDWGTGFDVEQVEPSRFGLEGIRERARLFGGRAHIDSSPGNGTRITVELPISEDPE